MPYYVRKAGKQHGQFSADQLKKLAAAGKLIACEKKRQAAIGQSEILDTSAALSKASVAAGKARMTYRDLGEECIAAEFASRCV